MNFILKSSKMQIIVSNCGAEIKSVKDNAGHEYMWQGDERFWSDTAPVLFPICGRLLDSKYTYCENEYKMKGHGFACSSEFDVVEVSDTSITLSLFSTDETKCSYPFDFELYAKYRLEEDTLYASFTVKNTSSVTMPYMFGWHPGFNLENSKGSSIPDFILDYGKVTEVTWYPIISGWVRAIPEAYRFESPKVPLNEDLIYKYDTLIYEGTDNRVRLYSDKEKHSVDMSWSANLPFLCIWKEPTPDARFICLEPWSAIPSDGSKPECFDDRKMNRLDKGGSETFSYTVSFK